MRTSRKRIMGRIRACPFITSAEAVNFYPPTPLSQQATEIEKHHLTTVSKSQKIKSHLLQRHDKFTAP